MSAPKKSIDLVKLVDRAAGGLSMVFGAFSGAQPSLYDGYLAGKTMSQYSRLSLGKR